MPVMRALQLTLICLSLSATAAANFQIGNRPGPG